MHADPWLPTGDWIVVINPFRVPDVVDIHDDPIVVLCIYRPDGYAVVARDWLRHGDDRQPTHRFDNDHGGRAARGGKTRVLNFDGIEGASGAGADKSPEAARRGSARGFFRRVLEQGGYVVL